MKTNLSKLVMVVGVTVLSLTVTACGRNLSGTYDGNAVVSMGAVQNGSGGSQIPATTQEVSLVLNEGSSDVITGSISPRGSSSALLGRTLGGTYLDRSATMQGVSDGSTIKNITATVTTNMNCTATVTGNLTQDNKGNRISGELKGASNCGNEISVNLIDLYKRSN